MAAEHFGNLAKHFVADLVAVRVVEFLEEVDVEQYERTGRALALPFAEAAFQFVVECTAIVQAGQRIGAGLGFMRFNFDCLHRQLLFGLLQALLQFGIGGEHLIHRR